MSAELEQRLEAVRAELDAELERRLDAGLCGCPCGRILGQRGGNGRKRYIDDRHKGDRYRECVKAEAEALGVVERQTLQTLRAAASTGERRADAQAPRKRAQRRARAGVSIYLPRPELVQRVLDSLEWVAGLGIEDLDERQRNADAITAVRKARARLERRRA